MNSAIGAFERYLNRRYPGSSTVQHYVNDLRLFQRCVDKPPREVTRQDVARFVEDQLARGLTATTINRRLACLHHFFEFLAAEAEDDSWANPVIWRQHQVKEGQPLPRDINDTDMERLSRCIQHPRDRLMFGLMYEAGLRVGEVAALRVVDLIPSSHAEQGARMRVCGKGQKERIVPLSVVLTKWWEEWLAQRPQVESDALFITRRKEGISERGIQDRLAYYCRQAGVQVSCHQLRHTFGRRMAEAEMPLPSLAKLLGHAQVTTTQLYIAGAGVDVRADYEAAMNRLDAECPGSSLFPATPCEPTGVPPAPLGSGTAGGGAALTPLETSEVPLDVDRLWTGLPVWLVEPLADYMAYRQHRWKASRARHNASNLLWTLCQAWRWLLEEREVDGFEALSRRDVAAYVDARLGAGIAASTLNRQLRDLRAFLRFIEEQGQPIAPGVFRLGWLKEGRPLPQFLSEEEYWRLEVHMLTCTAAGTPDDRLDRAWFYLLAHGGLRLCELRDVRLSEVDLGGQRLVIREGKGKRDRVIPLSVTTVTVLRDYLAVRSTAPTDHLLVFHQQALRSRWVQERLYRYGAAVNVRVSPHRLRHTLATRLVNVGMSITSIQRLLGHERLGTTMIYARVHDATVERDFREAMARLEATRKQHSAAMQTKAMPLVEELFSHTRESVSVAGQAPNFV